MVGLRLANKLAGPVNRTWVAIGSKKECALNRPPCAIRLEEGHADETMPKEGDRHF